MVAPIIPIIALLGKGELAFKYLGGSSIVFNTIKGTIFGTVLRAVEYPDGDLRTIKLRYSTLSRLRSHIAAAQPPPFPTASVAPSDIAQIALFTSPHFTEHITTDSHVSNLPDNAWLFWSKETYADDPIPTKKVKMDGSHIKSAPPKPPPTISDIVLQDRAIAIARRIAASSRRLSLPTPHTLSQFQVSPYLAPSTPSPSLVSANTDAFSHFFQHDRLVDLAVDRDASLLALSRNFGDDDDEFARHARRLLDRRSPQSILLADGVQAGAEEVEAEGEDAVDSKAPEPQVELAGRD